MRDTPSKIRRPVDGVDVDARRILADLAVADGLLAGDRVIGKTVAKPRHDRALDRDVNLRLIIRGAFATMSLA